VPRKVGGEYLDSFEDIVFKAIGKRVRLHVIVAENPPYIVEGILKEVNDSYILIIDVLYRSKFYINMNVSSIASSQLPLPKGRGLKLRGE